MEEGGGGQVVDPLELALKMGAKVDSPAKAGNPDPLALALKFGGKIAGPPPADPSVRDRLESAGRLGQALPGAIASVYGDYASGGLKGLGRMAAPVVKAVGLGNDYTDAALAPANPVQDAGGTAAQTGVLLAGGEAVGAIGAGASAAAKLARAAMTPAGIGVLTAGHGLASGHGVLRSAAEGAGAAVAGKSLPAVMRVLQRVMGKGAAPEVTAKAIADAEALLASKNLAKAEKLALEDTIKAARAEVRILERSERMNAKIKPIPANKLPPVLPDPVVPELAPAKAPRKPRQAKPKPAQEAPKAEPKAEAPKPQEAPPVKADAPQIDPIMKPPNTLDGVGTGQIMGKLNDHPGYKDLIEKVRGKSTEEAVDILAEAELKDWLIRPTIEMAGGKAPTPKMVRAAIEKVSDRKYDAWQASERMAAEGDVVTRAHPGQASPAFVNERLKYLQDQAAKRGDGPAKFAEQQKANKSLGAELADLLKAQKTSRKLRKESN